MFGAAVVFGADLVFPADTGLTGRGFPGHLTQQAEGVAGLAGQDVPSGGGQHDLRRGRAGEPDGLAGGRRQHHQAGAGVQGHPGYLGHRQVVCQVVH